MNPSNSQGRTYKNDTNASDRHDARMSAVKTQIPKAGKFVVCFVLGVMFVLSMQPWLNLSGLILKSIEVWPFLGIFKQIPFVGGVLSFLSANSFMSHLLGLGLCLWINLAESGKDLIKLFNMREGWWRTQLEAWNSPTGVGFAYLMEVPGAIEQFPIYKGGLAGIYKAFSTGFDINLVNWKMCFLFVISLLCFELVVKLFLPGDVKNVKSY